MIRQRIKKIYLEKAYQYQQPSVIPPCWTSETIHLKSGLIQSRIWKQKGASKGLALLVHPYHAQGKDYFIHTPHPSIYHDRGYDVAIFDLNGFGNSQDNGFQFRQNLIDIARYYRWELKSNITIGHGISFGAAVLLKSLSGNHPFTHAIIENCLDEVPNYYRARNNNLYKTIKLVQQLWPPLKASNQYYKWAEKIKGIGHLLLMYSADDALTTTEMGRKIAAHCAIDFSFVECKGGHMESVHADPEKYRRAISDYLNAKL